MRRIKLVAVITALLAGAGLARADTAADTSEGLIFAAISAPSTVSYTGTVEVVHIGDRGSATSVYRVEHRAPGMTRRVYVAPANLSGDIVLIKGDATYSVDVKRRRIVQTKNGVADDQLAVKRNYLLLRKNYLAVEEGDETFDGHPVYNVALINRYTHRPIILVRIDRTTKLPLDRQRFTTDGSLAAETRFENVRYTNAIPVADFAVPTQYAMVQGPDFGHPSSNFTDVVHDAGFTMRRPSFLPEGFSPVEGTAVAIKGVRTVHLLYSDGIRTVSLFEDASAPALDMTRLRPTPVRIAGHSGEYAEVGATRLLAWTDGQLRCALVGELSLPELERIAASVRP